MPPAVSDDESDRDQRASARKAGREKKAAVYNDEEMEDEDILDTNGQDGAAEDDEEEGDEDEEVFTVEKILSHMIEPSGRVLYEIKWEGYDKKSDRTWEPEEHLDNSKDMLEEYLASIGGREALFAETTTALKTKKRGRQSSTPQTSGKRSRRENGTHPADSDRPASVEAAIWRPPPGSWENDIADLDACEDEETGKLMVYLTWKNGKKTQHETPVIYQRCPQKMLQFYERHVRIIKRDPDSESS